MNGVEYIDERLMDALSSTAAEGARLRKNYNFHTSNASLCNRLLNAVEPGSYIRPHRHLAGEKDEAFIVVRGRLALFIFDDEGVVKACTVLGPGEQACGVNMAHGVWHMAMALERGTIFFEAKAGPYCAATSEEQADWAPAEGSESCGVYMEKMMHILEVGVQGRTDGGERDAGADR